MLQCCNVIKPALVQRLVFAGTGGAHLTMQRFFFSGIGITVLNIIYKIISL